VGFFSSIIREKSWHKQPTPDKAPPQLSANGGLWTNFLCLVLFRFTATIDISPQTGVKKTVELYPDFTVPLHFVVTEQGMFRKCRNPELNSLILSLAKYF
jgi:hypothetical protein